MGWGAEETETRKIIRANLSALLGKRNMTQKELAKTMGVSPSTISGWVSGGKTPRIPKLDKLCKCFEIDIKSIFTSQIQSAKDMSDLTELEKRLIENYRRLGTDQKQVIDMIMTAFMTEQAAAVFGNVIKSNKGNAFLNVNGNGTQIVGGV